MKLALMLSAKLAYRFTRRARKGGQRCYDDGQVEIEQGSASSVKARVGGAYKYEVNLNFADNKLKVLCRCDDWKRDGVCKHLWATILAADAGGHLTLAASGKNVLIGANDLDVLEAPIKVAIAPVIPQVQPAPPPKPPAPPPSNWRRQLTEISGTYSHYMKQRESWPAKREILYIVETLRTPVHGGIVISLESREPKADGTWKPSKRLNLKHGQIPDLPLAEDREILSMLTGCKSYYGWGYGGAYDSIPEHCEVKQPLANTIMPLLARTGRCYLLNTNLLEDAVTGQAPIQWDDAGVWHFELHMQRTHNNGWALHGMLCRGDEQMELSAPVQIVEGGLVFTRERAALLAQDTPFQWLSYLRGQGVINAPEKDRDDLLSTLLCSPGLPPLQVPEELRYEKVQVVPVPCLRVRAGNQEQTNGKPRLRADLSFDYEGRIVHEEKVGGWYEAANRRFVARDPEAEKTAVGLLSDLGFKLQGPTYWDPKSAWEVAPTKLPHLVRALVDTGWRVEADGKVFRRPGTFHIEVSSGVDWFELRGEVQYGDSTAKLPELLQALRRGENIVSLGNGDYGILPEEWLRRFGHVAGMGTPVNGHLRFQSNQAGLLDALLAAQPEATCDETFARVRQELASFQGIEAAEQPPGFLGQLRDYQREGLGWMHFLRRFSFGGCLADDMGVGKTAQVLALLEGRRQSRGPQADGRPSLVVVPKSLVFNWKLEAARFTPKLRLLDYTGVTRKADFADYDVVLTTYGTVRRDALALKDIEFDYVVLDEAQAVKNAESESSKAVRLLRGQHRLALSGTPIENHLGELWTLFEFLNPGMLGASSAFKVLSGPARNPSEDARRFLAGALRPFVLRRTKEQVARELPPKTEQTIYCEMEPLQRKLYQELLQHYRDLLLKRIETDGIAKSKIQVLEALLRLRQAACHPGLLDPKRKVEPSAKLEVLLSRVSEVIEEGHKALVFSQFTSLLHLVRSQLDEKQITYEYLDGATRDRQARVEHFQTDPDCRLFLISLKAGGLGLNLTAAEYVFLLDPWWNPAVEAQAMDRAHRIGQTRQVFAYRLITRGTVEEKVLELQQGKRDLAAAIISADNSLIRNLQREDLELLLS